MSLISINTELQFYLNGEEVNAPIQWRDISVLATFENDNIQANITVESFDLVLEARSIVLDWINQGRIFEGIPFQIIATNINRETVIFDGVINLATELELLPDAGKVRIKIEKEEGLNRLEQKIEGLTYGYLYELGIITESDFVDVPYVIDPINNAFDTVVLVFMATFLINEAIQQAQEVADAAATFAGILSSGLAGGIGAAVFAGLNVLLQIAKLAALVLALADLAKRVFNALIQPVRKHKGIKLKTLIEKACAKIGYTLETEIPDKIVYLPSNLNADERGEFAKLISVGTIKKGIPNQSDYGYSVPEAFELAKKVINGRYAVRNGRLQLRAKGSDYWQSQASYQVPDTLIETQGYNTNELIGDRLFSFDTDVADEYTITDFTGTNYEVITSLKGDVEESRNMVKGFDNVRFNVCLGSRKEKINPLEEALRFLANTFDSVIRTFGGRSNLASRIDSRTGVLRVSSNQHTKPKLLWLDGGEIPRNHREKLSAKTIENNYYIYDSFVRGEGQKVVNNSVRTGFGLEDFVKLVDNRYFKDAQGQIAESDRIEWNIGSDSATFNYFVRTRYTEQLEETFIEG